MKGIHLGAIALLILLLAICASMQFGILHLDHFFLNYFGAKNSPEASTIWQVRFPRMLGALVIGAGLGVAGALAQAIFRNPLAEPSLIGLSSGATLGSVLLISLGATTYGSLLNAGASSFLALIIGLLIMLTAPRKGSSFLLTGIALSSLLIALAGIMISISPKPGIQSLAFWNFGSLTLLSNSVMYVISPFIAIGVILAMVIAPKLDIYSLGDTSSHFLGVDPRRVRAISIISMALIVGSAVSSVGSIAFLGLLVPHIVRIIIGPQHKSLLFFSGILGATVLLVADFASRMIAQPHEIPLGLLTSFIGAPVLIFLIRSSQPKWVNND